MNDDAHVAFAVYNGARTIAGDVSDVGINETQFTGRGHSERVVRGALDRCVSKFQPARAQIRVEPAPAPAAPKIDYGQQQALADDQLVDGADLPELLADLDTALGLDPEHADTQKWRSKALERLTAWVRHDPSVAADVAASLATLTGADHQRISYLASALSSANTPDATNALAGILTDDLDRTTRHSVHSNLSLTAAPTAESFGALQDELDGELGDSAAMALGAQARQMDETAEPVKSALEQLIERYRGAQTADQLTCLIVARSTARSL